MLEIDRNLAWKVHRLMHARSAAEAAAFVPGRAGMEILCGAAGEAGVERGVVEGLRGAFEAYDRIAATHAGDRRSARLMLRSEDPTAEDGAELGLRRAAYDAASFMAGLRARAHLQTYIVSPGSKAGWADMIALRAMYDLERLRAEAPFYMARVKHAKPGDAKFQDAPVAPLDDSDGAREVPLVRRFCSSPLPTFRAIQREDGRVDDELTNWPVGKTGAVTVVAGVWAGNHFNTAPTGGEAGRMGARVRVPCQVLLLDQFVDRAVWAELPAPEVEVYCELTGDATWYTQSVRGLRVPTSARIEPLGRGITGAGTPDVPRYHDLLEFAFAARGLDPDRFDGWRIRIEFPLLPTGVSMVRRTGGG